MLGLPGSKEADFEFVMGAMKAAAAEAEVMPKGVEADLVPGSVAMLVEEPDAVVAEPMVVVAGTLVEPVEPMEVVLGIFVVAPRVAVAGCLLMAAVPMGSGPAAFVLEVDPKLAAFVETEPRVAEPVAEMVTALEDGPMVAEPVAETMVALEAGPMVAGPVAEMVVAPEAGPMVADPVAEMGVALEAGSRVSEDVPELALEADSMLAEFEEANYLWKAESQAEMAGALPMLAVVVNDSEEVPGTVLELDAMYLQVAVGVLVFVVYSRKLQEQAQAV